MFKTYIQKKLERYGEALLELVRAHSV